MGGRSIFRVRAGESNVNVILETLTDGGRNLAMAQRYLPEIVDGDKRILLIDGKPVDYCLARIPQGDEFRGNLAAGGRGEGRPLSERDRWIAAQVGPRSEEHTSELQSLMRSSYAGLCCEKNRHNNTYNIEPHLLNDIH